MCNSCQKKELENISNEIRETLIKNNFIDLLDIKEEIMLINENGEGDPIEIFGDIYVNAVKRISNIFKKQEKVLNYRRIIKSLFEFRPVRKKINEDSDISKFVDKELNNSELSNFNTEGKEFNEWFFDILLAIIISGFNYGGSTALEQFKDVFTQSEIEALQQLGNNIIYDFDLTDKEVIDYLRIYVIDRLNQLNEVTKQRIKEIIVIGYTTGLDEKEISKQIKQMFDDFSVMRAELIAMTEIAISSGMARFESFIRRGIVYKQWNTLGPRPCAICIGNRMQGAIPINQRFASGDLVEPSHPRCYSDDTEVYTENGWKLFKDLIVGEKIYSLNKETLEAEYVNFNKFIEYNYKGDMIIFKSRELELKVTPNHTMLFGKRRNKIDRKEVTWILDDASKLTSDFRLFRGEKYNSGKDYVYLFDKKIDGKIFAGFMGYYLSEGCVTKRNKNSYQIIISQFKKDILEKIYYYANSLGFVKVNKLNNRISIYDKNLGEYLIKFGKSFEKYIPKEIKELNTECIKVFVECYIDGDGTRRKKRMWKGYEFKEEETIFTSSKKMADDFCEISLKIGKSVSYSIDKEKGTKMKFKNGVYALNYDVFRIRLLNKLVICNSIKIEKEKYDGLVYDVELDKNHILLVRRKGKIIWSGNCLCRVTPVLTNDFMLYSGYTWYGGKQNEITSNNKL